MNKHPVKPHKRNEEIGLLYRELDQLMSIIQDFLLRNPTLDDETNERFFALGKLMLNKANILSSSTLTLLQCNQQEENSFYDGLMLATCMRTYIEDIITFLWLYYSNDRQAKTERFYQFIAIEEYELAKAEYEIHKGGNNLIRNAVSSKKLHTLKQEADKNKQTLNSNRYQREQGGENVIWDTFHNLSARKMIDKVKSQISQETNPVLKVKHTEILLLSYKANCKSTHTSPYHIFNYANQYQDRNDQRLVLEEATRSSLKQIIMTISTMIMYLTVLLHDSHVEGNKKLAVEFQKQLLKMPH